jgi:hypothetical protein
MIYLLLAVSAPARAPSSSGGGRLTIDGTLRKSGIDLERQVAEQMGLVTV